jgi:iron complex outermembrane receptor protein/vitamin B12 transporter
MVAAGAALAQEQPAAQALDKVEITGSRVPLTMHELPESISEITRADIQRLGPATGVDLFRHVPGLQIDQLGGPGGLSSVYIRGSDPNHVLVLVDGVRVNDSTNSRGGGFDMSSLDPSSIERIEVLRGAASSIYGAEAMGGVINIVTRNGLDATGLQAGGGAGIGGQDFRSANARMSAGAPNMRMSVNASKLKDGNDIEGGELDFSQVGAAAKWRIDPTAFLNLELRHNERKSSSFPDDSGGIELAKLRTLERKQSSETSLGIRGRRALDASTLNFAATTYRHIEDIVSPGVAPGVRSAVGVPSSVSGTDYRRSNATANGVVHLGGEDQLAVGVEYQRERGANRTSYTFFGRLIPVDFELTRNTRSAFSELKWQPLQDLTVRAGLHYDDVGGVG